MQSSPSWAIIQDVLLWDFMGGAVASLSRRIRDCGDRQELLISSSTLLKFSESYQGKDC